MTIAAADGSCIGNPGPGGWGWITTDGRSASAAAKRTTNNRMELRAVLELLKATDSDESLVIQTDSAYVVGIFTQWLDGWRRNGMRTAARRPVENTDLIKAIDRELQERIVTFEKVPGHAGHVLNEKADALAQSAARGAAERISN